MPSSSPPTKRSLSTELSDPEGQAELLTPSELDEPLPPKGPEEPLQPEEPLPPEEPYLHRILAIDRGSSDRPFPDLPKGAGGKNRA